jgi:hypothetical protein
MEENLEHAELLAGKAEKYIEYALSGLVFFIAFEFSSGLSSLHILLDDDVWFGIAISVSAALIARYGIRKITHI